MQTVSDYPLVEAIRQGVVKTPVLPDAASRAKLHERKSAKFTEQYEDYLHLGFLEWKQVYDEFEKLGRKAILFVMTDDTRNCDEVKEYLESRYAELNGAVLVIHTKNNGEISEASSGKSKEELDRLRTASRVIDSLESPYKAIVSVMVLREGWDVQNVTSIVGLRPYSTKSKILPEQTLGRGLRRMFRGQDVLEKVSVIGTQAFMDFVESIKLEGVELEYQPMGAGTAPKSPMVVEVDRENSHKDIDQLEIEMPVLAPRIYREYKNLEAIDVTKLGNQRLPLKQFSEEQQREIVFRDINTEETSHTTVLDSVFEPNYQNLVGFFTRNIMRDLRLVGGFDVLFGKMKAFVESELFPQPVDLTDLNVLRNLSEIEAVRAITEGFKPAIVGTGSEDYFLGSWNFGGQFGAAQFAHAQYGAPLIVNPERTGGKYCCYRWHGDNPVTFERYLKHTMEHGHANDRGDNFYSAAYWYQSTPYTDFPALPPVAQRIPMVKAG